MGLGTGPLENMVMDVNFWCGRRVFLTGHTGFKGGWLALWLQSLKAEVWGYALAPPSEPSLFDVAQVAKDMHSLHGDIRDLDALRTAMQAANPEVVIHLAAQALVRPSYLNPVETYASNVMGTVNVLEAVRDTPSVRVVINVTSDKCYDNKEWVWGYRENDPMGGYDPYSSSKGCAELVASAYRNSFFNPAHYAEHRVALASVRAGNVMGGGDWAKDRLIPDFMRSILAGQPVVIRSPLAVRPWQHVLEPLHGYLALAEKLYWEGPAYVGGWNFGPQDSDARNVAWIVEFLTHVWGEGAAWCLDELPQPHEAHYLKLDISKARMHLGWEPCWHLEQALDAVVSWYRSWTLGENMRNFSLGQIKSYQARTSAQPTE